MSAPVLLVRHGESEWNVARRTQGQTPHPALTLLGREQAAQAAKVVAAALTDGHPVRVVSSDLVRARQTAEAVASVLGVDVELDERLREMALGDLEGCSYEETWRRGEEHDWSDPDLGVGRGESPREVHDRMAAAVADALAVAGAGTAVVLVTHGDALRHAANALAGHGPLDGEWLEVPNGAVFAVGAPVVRLG
ncbi:MAG: histidine phosphatase family protein [Nocardioides sp.]|uniref:histidine phosphatase family protein n=1 Tax=Nocardioides sp. TaxID=35761 RepID=UPI003EFEFBB6